MIHFGQKCVLCFVHKRDGVSVFDVDFVGVFDCALQRCSQSLIPPKNLSPPEGDPPRMESRVSYLDWGGREVMDHLCSLNGKMRPTLGPHDTASFSQTLTAFIPPSHPSALRLGRMSMVTGHMKPGVYCTCKVPLLLLSYNHLCRNTNPNVRWLYDKGQK